MQCVIVLESQGLVDAHMNNYKNKNQKLYCDLCDEEFHSEKDLWKHNNDEHDTSRSSMQWNCNNCDFQSTTSPPLMNHCKQEGHQPSRLIQDTRNGIIKCNTCELEFTSYWNMMNHRKQMHPSTRKCRDYPSGKCKHGDVCWFVHDNALMDHDGQESQTQSNEVTFKCHVCDTNFTNRNEVMIHKKREHPSFILCKDYNSGLCRRSQQECWYLHQAPRPCPLPRHVSPSNVSSNTPSSNSFPQVKQSDLSTPITSPWTSASTSFPLARERAHILGEEGGGSSLTNPSQQSQQVNFTQGFHNPPSTPPPPEPPVTQVMMLQFAQMMQKMQQMEVNLQMLLQKTNNLKFPST